MHEHTERIIYRQGSERVLLDHVLDGQSSTPERFSSLTTRSTIMPFHLCHVSVMIIPLIPVQAREEILQAGVVEDDDARMTTTDLPDGGMKTAVITKVENAHVAAVHLCPAHLF